MSSLFCSEFVMLDDTSLGHDKQTLLEFVRISVIVGDSPPRIREHPPKNSNTVGGLGNKSRQLMWARRRSWWRIQRSASMGGGKCSYRVPPTLLQSDAAKSVRIRWI